MANDLPSVDPRMLIPGDPHGNPLSLKPLLAVAIHEAVAWALVDSTDPELAGCTESFVNGDDNFRKTRAGWVLNPHTIPAEALASIDPSALAQNICVRLLGPGGWDAGGIYHGNASPQQTFDALVRRPHEDPLGDIKMSLGLAEPDDKEADRG